MTTFADAVRVPPITHESIDDLFAPIKTLRTTAHLLLDQRNTARDLAVTLEQTEHDLRVALTDADAMLRRIADNDFWSDTELGVVRATVARALAVTV